MRFLVLCIFLFSVTSFYAVAAQLGVNYYDETLMNTNTNSLAFIPRSIYQVGQDFDNIKSISNNVKFYMDPFIDANLPWILQVNSVAKQKGMHTVVNMMVQFPQLDNNNWGDYSNRVINACINLNNKADEVLVGNEITLHSPLSRQDIKNKVVDLMNKCRQVYSGLVSYEEFWYAKDVWQGFNGPLYFMMYEGLPSFQTNMNELGAKFGSNGRVGEWGEDLLDGNIEKDENWQRDQIQQRWNIIQQSSAPVAYIFTYREPSWTSFSMLRPNTYVRRPLWTVFGAPTITPIPTPAPPPTPSPPSNTGIGQYAVTSSVGSLKTDSNDGSCRTIIYGTSGGDIKAFACLKPDGNIEIYRQQAPNLVFKLCISNGCIDQNTGYTKFKPTASLSPVTPPPAGINGLLVTSSAPKIADFIENTGCRYVQFGDTAARICAKISHYEMYKQFGNTNICVNGACVGSSSGFASFS